MVKARTGGKTVQVRKRRKQRKQKFARPLNETAYKGCKVSIKRFSNDPSKKTYQQYQRALNDLFGVNPTRALAFRKQFKQMLFEKALKEENFQ